jgi:ubiquinol-cytochrome c reductase subunit 6
MIALLRHVQADEEPVDPKPEIEKQCHKPCEKQWNQYQACVDRITKKGEGHCEEWAFDYWHCIDKCVST